MVYVNSIHDIANDIAILDGLSFFLTLLTIWHTILYTRWEGFRVIATVFLMALMTEQLSVQLGHTHCHADGLVMLSKCSSLNSVLTYVPCTDTCCLWRFS
jgi:hypothetical protein